MCGCLSRARCCGPGLKPRHVPWLGIQLVSLQFYFNFYIVSNRFLKNWLNIYFFSCRLPYPSSTPCWTLSSLAECKFNFVVFPLLLSWMNFFIFWICSTPLLLFHHFVDAHPPRCPWWKVLFRIAVYQFAVQLDFQECISKITYVCLMLPSLCSLIILLNGLFLCIKNRHITYIAYCSIPNV